MNQPHIGNTHRGPIGNPATSRLHFHKRIFKRNQAVQKGLCYFALTVAVIVFACFLADLLLGLTGNKAIAPFHYADRTTDIVFLVCSAIFGLLSWITLREQV